MSTISVTREPMDIPTAIERLAEIGWRKHDHEANHPQNFCITNGDSFLWLGEQAGAHGEPRVIVARYGRNEDGEVYDALNMVSEYDALFGAILFTSEPEEIDQ